MASTTRTTNQEGILAVKDSVSGTPFYVQGVSATGSINVNVTAGGGGGTQYTDGGTPPTHPIGNALEYINGSNIWTTVSTTNPLPITGSISVGGTTDGAAFTAGTSTFTSSGGVYNDSVANLVSGNQGAQRLTIARAVHINLRNSTGTEIGTSGTPIQVSLANTGSNSTAVAVTISGNQAVNIAQVGGATFALGQQLAASSLPIVLTAAQITTLTPPAAITNYALETGGNLATLAGTVTSAVLQENVKQINGVTPLMGNGVTGTGSQRVTIASDNSAFSVNSTLSAETTKVIGTVNQGTSPWVVSLSSTTITGTVTVAGAKTNNNAAPGATNIGALIGLANAAAPTYTEGDQVLSSLDLSGNTRIIGSVTANAGTNLNTSALVTSTNLTSGTQKTQIVDGSGNVIASTSNALNINISSGSIANTSFAATQATASSLNATVVGTGTFAVQATLSAETTKVIGTVNQGSAATVTAPWPVYNGELADTTGTFTNATQTTSVTATGLDGYGNILISISGTYGTATAVFEGSDDSGTTWYPVDAAQTSGNIIEGGYTSLTNVSRVWQVNVPGFDSVRVRSTAVASGTVNVRMSPSAALGADASTVSLGNALPTGTNSIGNVGSSTATGSAVPANAFYNGFDVATALPTAGSVGNLVGAMSDKFGRGVVLPNAIRDIMGTQTTTITASTAETTIITSVASTFLDLVSLFISNTSATAVNVAIRDTTAGTVIFTLEIPAGDMRGFSLTTPWPQTTAATNWTATSSGSVTSLVVSALFIKNK